MVDHPTSLDAHRGMAAQKATELRRLRSEVEAEQAALHARQRELEDLLAAASAANWPATVEKARYLLGLYAQSSAAVDPRRRKLIDRVMADFDHLLDSRLQHWEQILRAGVHQPDFEYADEPPSGLTDADRKA